MNLSTKRRYKRYAKLSTILMLSSIIYFFLGFITILVFSIPDVTTRWIIGISTIASPFVGLIVSFYGLTYHRELLRYKGSIQEYRIRKLFVQTCKLIDSGDLKAAIDIYNNRIPEGHSCRDYLFTLLIHKCYECNDPELVKKGRELIERTREFYNPANIVFN